MVVKNAQKRLDQLEAEKRAMTAQVDLFDMPAESDQETPANAEHVNLILEKLNEIDPDELSPREALQLIFQLKGLQS
jgi:DNA mismatch repair protein MutS